MHVPVEVARLQLRRGWRTLLGISLLVTLVGGLALGAAAGARRTATAVDRMIDATDAAHVLVNPDRGDESALDFDAVADLPMVRDFSRIHGVVVIFDDGDGIALDDLFAGPITLASVDGRAPFGFHRPVLQGGRLPDPAAADEVLISSRFARSSGLDVGDVLPVVIPSGDDLRTLFGFESLDDGLERAEQMLASPGFGNPTDLRVVGVGTWLDGVVVDEGYFPLQAWITPARYEADGAPSAGYGGAVVRLDDRRSVDEFRRAVEAMAPDEKIVFQTRDVMRDKALRGTLPAAAALALFAAITSLFGLVVVGQATSRWCRIDARDNETLAAMGSTRVDRALSRLSRLAVAVTVGCVGAMALSVLASPLTPVGAARSAEPDPGFALDGPVVVGGGVTLLVVLVAIAAVPSWRSAPVVRPAGVVRGSAIARWFESVGASPYATTGVRFGLEPGRGSTSVPTRTTNAGAVIAIAIAVATVVFASSLERMVGDGRFYGTRFDVTFDWDGVALNSDSGRAEFVSMLRDDPDVDRVGVMRVTEVVLDGRPVTSISFSAGDDAIEPTIAAGRAPATAGEIALGATTMDELGVGIGDVVALESSGFDGAAEVVGRAVLPGAGLYEGSDRTSIGTGAILAPASLGPVGETADKALVVAGLVTSADRTAFEARISEGWASIDPTGTTELYPGAAPRPAEIESLGRLRALPVVLSALLVLLVGVTVVQAMVVAVRRRRRDVAVLRAIGSTTRGVTVVGVVQGVTIASVGVLVGVPLGIVAGRRVWIALADEYGTLAEPVVPASGLAMLVVAVVAIACIAGAAPNVVGLRHRPAEVLRAE